MRWKLGLLLAFVFLFAGFISAGFNVSDSGIQKNYGAADDVSGWIEISFGNQSINSTVLDNLGNSISLGELLDLNPDYVSVLNSDNFTISSSFQKLYFDNASFSLPSSELSLFNYNISLDGIIVLSENISISNSQDVIVQELHRKREILQNLTNQIDTYPLFLRSQIKSAINLNGLEDNLTNIEITYNSSTEGFDLILNELDKIKIPETIFETESANQISFIPDTDNINLDILQTIGGGSYDFSAEEQYKNAILFWVKENLDPRITFKKISAQYENGEDNLLTYIKLTTTYRASSEVYFITDDLNNLKFEKDYKEIAEGNYIYIDWNQIDREIIFTTTEDLDIDNLPMFISQPLSMVEVGTGENIIDSEKESKVAKWVLFSLIIVLIIIIFAVIYFILKSWYDRKYENYLFKNKNNLYNLVVYINNAKRKGMKDFDIEKNLRKAKWSSEQIRYVMRKYAGKRTGLWGPEFSRKNMEAQHTKFNKPRR